MPELTHWQKRELAKEKVAGGLRKHLLCQFKSLPVRVVRNRIEKIRADNKAWVREFLGKIGCEDVKVSWHIAFEYKVGKCSVARISDFIVFVETT